MSIPEPIQNLNLHVAIGRLKTGFDEVFPRSSEALTIMMDSTPLTTMTFKTLKYAGYLFLSKRTLCWDMIGVRTSYMEVTWLSSGSMVHHLLLSVFYSFATLCTLGLSRMVRQELKKHWVHTAISTICFVSSVWGFFVPRHAALVNFSLIYYSYQILKERFPADYNEYEPKLIQNIKEQYMQHQNSLYEAVRLFVKDAYKFETFYLPRLEVFSNAVSQASTLQDLYVDVKNFLRDVLAEPNSMQNQPA